MARCARRALLLAVPVLLLWSSLALAAGVHALFNLEVPAGHPFPSDRFTVADPRQLTGLKVQLPKPNCGARPSDCADLDVLNTLDGFNLAQALGPFRRAHRPQLRLESYGDSDKRSERAA